MNTKDFPYTSIVTVDGEEYLYPLRQYRSDHNICEREGFSPCSISETYYGCEDDAGKLCLRHFLELHETECRLVSNS